mgnify:CR=1 FL=1
MGLRHNGTIEPLAVVCRRRVKEARHLPGGNEVGDGRPGIQVWRGLNSIIQSGGGKEHQLQAVSAQRLRGPQTKLKTGNRAWRSQTVEAGSVIVRSGIEDVHGGVGAGEGDDRDPAHEVLRGLQSVIASHLTEDGIEVLFDDRKDISPGFKFKDADLLGMPYQVIVGEKNLGNGKIEIKNRRTGERILVEAEKIIEKVQSLLA